MDILIIGGTVFLGRAITDAALASGHRVTHFNRGNHPDPRVTTITGDRTKPGDLAELVEHGPWHAVIDTCGYLPQVVQDSLDIVATQGGRYVFISSISAYADPSGPGITEASPLLVPPKELPEKLDMALYGELKAGCEARVFQDCTTRALIIRPGLIVGPHDPTDRFTWWPARVAAGGEVAAPGRPSRPVQFVDARDVASFVIRAIERNAEGAFNVVGPSTPVPMGELLEACARVSGSKATFTWIDDDFLVAQGVGPYIEMPLWIPEKSAHAGFMSVSMDRARAAGLAFRPLEETLADTLAWSRTRPAHAWKAGLPPDREAALLEAWKKR